MSTSWIEALKAAGDALSGQFIKVAGGQDPDGNAQPVQLSAFNSVQVLSRADQTRGYGPSPGAGNVDSEANIRVDAESSLITRGSVLTDEGSFRDDFEDPNASLFITLSGTVTVTNGSNIVTGVGTAFLTDVTDGEHYLKRTADGQTSWVVVASVESDTQLTLESNYVGTTGTGAHVSHFIPLITGGASQNVASSICNLVSSTASGNIITLRRFLDYQPIRFRAKVSISQRIANQTSFIGVATDDTLTPLAQARFVFDGTSDTTVKIRCTNKNGVVDEQTVTLPDQLTTASSLYYEILVLDEKVVFSINKKIVGVLEDHIPDVYETLDVICSVRNTAVVTTTTMAIDYIFVANYNQVEIGMGTTGKTLPVAVTGEFHRLLGRLTTNATTANQVVLTYTVPAGRELFVWGYTVANNSTTINSTNTKVGKNTITDPASGTQATDGNFLEILSYVVAASANNPLRRDYSIPVPLGVGGDVIKIAVTPSGGTSTNWTATMIVELR